MTRFAYRLDSSKTPYHILTLRTHWRKLPPFLESIRSIPLDVKRAYISKEQSTLFLKEVNSNMTSHEAQAEIFEIIHKSIDTRFTPVNKTNQPIPPNPLGSIYMPDPNPIRLPVDTQIIVYNVPGIDYTTMEFGCQDKVGLLSDLIQSLCPFPFDIQSAFISTIGSTAHNILYLEHRNLPLSDDEMTYLRNVFEYEAKQRLGGHFSELF